MGENVDKLLHYYLFIKLLKVRANQSYIVLVYLYIGTLISFK